MARQGRTDEEIARCLTDRGHHSPRHTTVLPSSVRFVRLRHRLLRDRRQSHPRRIPGFLTVPQLIEKLGSRTELDLRSHPQRHDPGRARRRTKAVSVPGHPRDPRPVPTTPGGEAQLLAFLGGHQDAISKNLSDVDLQDPPAPHLHQPLPEGLQRLVPRAARPKPVSSSPGSPARRRLPGPWQPHAGGSYPQTWGSPEHTTPSSQPPSGSVTITHPHHPLRGQRVEIVRFAGESTPISSSVSLTDDTPPSR